MTATEEPVPTPSNYWANIPLTWDGSFEAPIGALQVSEDGDIKVIVSPHIHEEIGKRIFGLVRDGVLKGVSISTAEVRPKSHLLEHAERELRLLGTSEGDISYVLHVLHCFSSYGHSGGSAEWFVPVMNDLLQFKNLSPLTQNPGEWMEVTEGLWQNKRRSDAFSKDGGMNYYLLQDGSNFDVQVKMYEAQGRP